MGMEHGIEKNDRIITGYRCHPFAVLRGGTIRGVIAELLGRQDGMSHGKGGSMHIFTPSFFGGNGIVGAQVPIGAGAAFAQMYKGEKNCTFAMYGDGASNQGQVFEAMNMVCAIRFSFSTLSDLGIIFFFCRPSCGTSLPSLFVRITSTEWVPLRSVARPTLSTLPEVTRSLVSKCVIILLATHPGR